MHIFRHTSKQHINILECYARDLCIMGTTLTELQGRSIERSIGNTQISETKSLGLKKNDLPKDEIVLFSDNLFFTPEFLSAFLAEARKQPVDHLYCAALSTSSQLVQDFVQPLCCCPVAGNLLSLDLFYIKVTCSQTIIDVSNALPLFIELLDEQVDHLALPPLAKDTNSGHRVVFQDFAILPATDFAPLRINTGVRLALPIMHWVHVLTANIVFGVYGDAIRYRDHGELLFYNEPSAAKLPNNIREVVSIGEGCSVDPSSTIIGPSILGENVKVEPGVTIAASIIGDNTAVGQGNQIRLSVIEKDVILPPSTNMMLWSFLGRRSLINSQMRFSVVGEDCFIGAATFVTDRILDGFRSKMDDTIFGDRQAKVRHRNDVVSSGYRILGAAFGNRSMTCSGTVLYPGRELPTDSVTRLQEEQLGGLLALIK